MNYLFTEEELKQLAKLLEEIPFKYSCEAMDLLKVVVNRTKAQFEEAAKLVVDAYAKQQIQQSDVSAKE